MGQEALFHATCAAELYMKAVAEITTAQERSRLRARFEKVFAIAERWKNHNYASLDGQRNADFDGLCGQTLSISPCSLHGVDFPPWRQPEGSMFCLPPGETQYADPTDFKFSVQQQEILDRWRRPSEIISVTSDHDDFDDMFMQTGDDSDLVQDITADCSVVASLCAAMKVMRTGPRSILSSIMYPYDRSKGQPAMSPSGKHTLRMFFNGCFRKVVIDNRLPCSRTDRLLYVTDQQKPSLLWPALIEKAYLKVRGGYNFPGSNSATDLFVITGWIPEQLFLQRYSTFTLVWK
jgi:calpain-7